MTIPTAFLLICVLKGVTHSIGKTRYLVIDAEINLKFML